MLRSRSRPIGWAKVRLERVAAVPVTAFFLAVGFYVFVARTLGLPEEGQGLAIALLSGSVLFLVAGLCGLKRGYFVSISFPATPTIIVGPHVILQSYWLIALWAIVTVLVGYGYLSH